MRNLWRSLWYGLSLADFLRVELRWTPVRRIFTIRLFAVLMFISLVSVTLRPPPTIALSFAFVMMLGSAMTDYAMTLLTALRLVKLVLIAIGLSILSLALWGDQPWFLVPWSFGLITLLLFHARTTGSPTIMAVLYVAVVLMNAEQPGRNIYSALWLFPTLVMLTFGSALVAHLTLWPQDPLDELKQHLSGRLDTIIHMLDRLVAPGQADAANGDPPLRDRPRPGAISRHFHLLGNAEYAHPEIKAKRPEWTDLIVEIDTWFNNVSALTRLVQGRETPRRFGGREFSRLLDNAALCRELRADFLESKVPRPEPAPRLPEHTAPKPPSDPPVAHFVHRLDDAASRIRKTLADLHGAEAQAPAFGARPEPKFEPPGLPALLGRAYWIDNIDALHFGMKFALATLVCLLVIEALHWPDIGTAMLTCVIVAQSSLGASYRMSLLRIVGAILGGVLAYTFIIAVQPALDTVAGFLLAIAPVCWLAAWVGSGSPRIAYIGTQIGFSFANAVLPGYGPVTHLASAWDRVLGILLGIVVAGLIDYLVWPQHSERMSMARLVATLRTLGKFLSLETASADKALSAGALMRSIDADLQRSASLLEHAEIEPGAQKPEAAARVYAIDLVLDAMHGVARVVQARHRYHLDSSFRAKTQPLLERQDALNQALSETLSRMIHRIEQKPSPPAPSCRPLLTQLENSARELISTPGMDWETQKSILACVDLDKILLDYMEGLESLVDNLGDTSSPASIQRG
ncbi:Uncharacterized membrane protein YccC [Methylomagnum ishizawai]|uniref:Uncharacterized membrane protein YccC n=1 Tax=Methylomagnum ishizawai TaxID=1760988 RepID=A0A1Y6D545_9GAMM|nr:FUSC family protein [Methylomagnum ishizawai]SMF95075.1 Uncharacterized membrane protein YccC [Methylomagnum ishizawai]